MNIFSDINLIVFDFDGVFTDNRVGVLDNGHEFVICNRSDGLGVNLLKNLKIQMLILSTEKNNVVKERAKKLNLPCISNSCNKANDLKKYCNSHNLELKNTAFVGNDINDLEVMKLVKLRICPSDAHPLIKKISDLILNVKGGHGVVRELFDIISSYKFKLKNL